MTAAERRWIGRAVEHGCMVCLAPAQWHHLRSGSAGIVGGGQRSAHTRGIALCERHHTGSDGIHQIGVETWEAKHGRQTDLHAHLVSLIGEPPAEQPKRSGKWRTAKIIAR